MLKVLYQPLGLLVSVLGGIVAAAGFNQLWRLLPNRDSEAPDSTDPERTWREIAVAATQQGAVFGGVKALIDRAGARGLPDDHRYLAAMRSSLHLAATSAVICLAATRPVRPGSGRHPADVGRA